MTQRVKTDKYFISTFISLLSVFLIFFNLQFWHSTWLGLLFFGIYLIINSIWLNKILSKIISLDSPYCYLLSVYCLLILLAFGGAVFIVLWKITPWIMISILLILSLVISALNHFVLSLRGRSGSCRTDRSNPVANGIGMGLFHHPAPFGKSTGLLTMITGSVFMFLCFLFLWKARTGNYILSPWQTIHPVYLYFWFFITFLVGYLIFTERRLKPAATRLENSLHAKGWRIILLIIILHSFLLHAYLPIVYKTGFGGDRWRHVASERYLQQGKIYSPALFGEQIQWQKFGPIKIPKVFLVGNKTSYANQWALTSFLSWILQIDVFWIDIFLLPILWSILIPLFLFILGRLFLSHCERATRQSEAKVESDRSNPVASDITTGLQSLFRVKSLFAGRRPRGLLPRDCFVGPTRVGPPRNDKATFPLLLAFLPSLFYPFQVYGSITIPTGFGFLLFLFILILFFNLLRNCNKKIVICYLLSVICLYFSYTLYLILFLEISLMYFLFKKIQNKKLCVISYVLLIICFLLLIPVLDTTHSLTEWKSGIITHPSLILASLGEFIEKLFGFGRLLLLPTHITQGNFIYMQVAKSLSSNTLLSLIKWPVIISSIIWGFIIYGLLAVIARRSFRFAQDRLHNSVAPLSLRGVPTSWSEGRRSNPVIIGLLAIFLVITLGNQFVSNYFMQGVHILSKRLDLTIAFLMLPFLGLGIYKFINSTSRLMTKKAKIILICLFLSLASTSTYASGPKLEVVTEDEIKAAEYVWGKLQATSYKLQAKNCVLANTWPLLALEAVSAREIITGGFPVYQEYTQPERVKLFNGMSMWPSRRYMEKALEITGASSCYFMTEKRFWNERDPQILEKLEKIFGDYKKIGEVYIFYYPK
jgi:hypothetical protein